MKEGTSTFVYKGLLRPATALGVPYQVAVIEFLVATMFFVGLNSLYGVLFVIPIHVLFYFVHQHDSQLVNVYWVSWVEVNPTRNKAFWGGNSYYS